MGTVYLVGAGPGNPELITVRGRNLLTQADCIVYDRLSSPELLDCAREGCEKIYVGKENHNHTLPQDEISELLVEKGRQYGTVVRLKGGDPYIFGRGGEEALLLRENGIPFEVVPGISSSVSGPMYAGIPVTHRGLATSFRVFTAHGKDNTPVDIDFGSLKKSGETCIFLMGLSLVGEIAAHMLAAGFPADYPAAVVSHATTPEQKSVFAGLSELAAETGRAGLTSPAIIVTGEVTRLHDRLDFFTGMPLFGRQYLVPKIGSGVSALAEKLREKGAAVRELQVGEIAFTGSFTAADLEKADRLVFTSSAGVNGFFRHLQEIGRDARALAHVRIAAIGPETEKRLRACGIAADDIPESYNSGALLELLKRQVSRDETVWYAGTEENGGSSLNGLAACCDYRVVPVYRNRAADVSPQSPASLQEYDGVFFTCASSLRRTLAACGGKLPEHCRVFVIGPKCAEAAAEAGITDFVTAEKSTYDGLVDAACNV